MAPSVAYTALFDGTAPTAPVCDASVGEFLRCSMGLSAWKQYRESRWALRVNPSSGNLHPTEAYVVRDGRVCHYAPHAHALEQRSVIDASAWQAFAERRDGFLVALTSILWREAWKYGERAFRYCQHDTGHAIAALRFGAALLGWKLTILSGWSDEQIATLLGLNRGDDFAHAEREEPECIAIVTPNDVAPWLRAEPSILPDAARSAPWTGVANQLSTGHVEWPIIEEVATVTRRGAGEANRAGEASRAGEAGRGAPRTPPAPPAPLARLAPLAPLARTILLQRRSALAFDARSRLPRDTFLSMLGRTLPRATPWDAVDWPPHIHLLLFVHRVEGLVPGVYAYLREPAAADEWRAAMRRDFLWERISTSNDPNDPNDRNDRNGPNDPNVPNDPNDLYLLVPTDVTWAANRVSCDQDIAADGFFSCGMIARMESSLRQRGEWFYRRLFWESGVLGQVLYLEAEAAGARATGIGCFYDDPVHELAGFSSPEWQSIYHFSMGMPVEDSRLTTEPGYPWESG